jgi:Ser/Thr protein kinase RdoA (MazF antagonist)
VRAYESLTERGRANRLRRLALLASARYPFEIRRCVCATRSFNTIFRIEATTGERYALRIAPRIRLHPEGTEAAEVAWLAALRRDGVVDVPVVIETTDGTRVVDVELAGVPEARRCVLFGWVPGRRVDRMDPAMARRLGALAALLHRHAADLASAAPPDIPVGDRVLYWRIDDRLDELIPAYGSLIHKALDRAQRTIDELWSDPPHAPHLLHGDLHPSNVITGGDRTVVIDFQDLLWGFEQQDLAIAISVLRMYPEPGRLLDRFRDGYVAVRPWPEMLPAELDALVAARSIQQLNLGLNVRKPGLDAFIARQATRIRTWMDG